MVIGMGSIPAIILVSPLDCQRPVNSFPSKHVHIRVLSTCRRVPKTYMYVFSGDRSPSKHVLIRTALKSRRSLHFETVVTQCCGCKYAVEWRPHPSYTNTTSRSPKNWGQKLPEPRNKTRWKFRKMR